MKISSQSFFQNKKAILIAPITVISAVMIFITVYIALDPAKIFNLSKANAASSVTGSMKAFQPITITFDGPNLSESSNSTFLNYRLNVEFSKDNKKYVVPGYFAADGNAANTSAVSGNKWTVHFTPDEAGVWNYVASFRTGTNIAINTNESAGSPTGFNGESGSFNISQADSNAAGFLKNGLLSYAGGHYLKFKNGEYFLKGGTDSPENFLAYNDFDATSSGSFGIHTYSSHSNHYNELGGGPTWKSGKGKNIIGALNYLSDRKVNSIYFLTMNIGGDGKDVWPFSDQNGTISKSGGNSTEKLTSYDVSKLDQWNIVFDHAQKKGIMLHFVLGETEAANERELYDGTINQTDPNSYLGIRRKLYFRELVARFGHHNALVWNLGEEANQGDDDHRYTVKQITDFANYIKSVDPYDHPIAVHGDWNWNTSPYGPFFGVNSLDVNSYQWYPEFPQSARPWDEGGMPNGDRVELLRSASSSKGKTVSINLDEPNRTKAVNDESHEPFNNNQSDGWGWPYESGQIYQRKTLIWPVYFSGGNLEYILDDMLTTNDFSRYEAMWNYSYFARDFIIKNIPFWDMTPADHLLTGESEYGSGNMREDGQVFMKQNEVYAIYLPNATNTGTLNLSGTSGTFEKYWFNPRTGSFSTKSEITGNGNVALGNPPAESNQDWVVLITKLGKTDCCGNTTPPQPLDGAFLDSDSSTNGLFVMQVESYPPSSFWQTEQAGTITYYNWKDGNYDLNVTPPGNGVLAYPMKITDGGTYQFRIRNRQVNIDTAKNDEANDVWAKMDNGDWVKLYSWDESANSQPAGGLGNWNWASKFVTDENGQEIFSTSEYSLSPGYHTFYLSGRSEGFQIDRIHFWKGNVTWNNANLPQSEREGSSSNPTATPTLTPTPIQSSPTPPGSTPTPTPVPPPASGSGGIVLTPTDDAYIENGVKYNNNSIRIQAADPSRLSYLKFVLDTGGKQISSTKLSMTQFTDEGSGPINIYLGSHNNWNESTLRDSNKPAKGIKVGTLNGTLTGGNTYEVNLSNITSDGTYTLILESNNSNQGADVWFSSKEGPSSPKLILNYNTTVPSPPPPPVQSSIYEAEYATLSGAVVDNSHGGYTGSGFADYKNSNNDYIEWIVNVPDLGSYNLKFRYALSWGNRPLQIKVNGSVVNSSLNFPKTGSWTKWSTVTTNANLKSGINKIRATAIDSSGANIDHLEIYPSTSLQR